MVTREVNAGKGESALGQNSGSSDNDRQVSSASDAVSPDRLVYLGSLVSRWAEYESIRIAGRAFSLPPSMQCLRYDVHTGGVHVVSEGPCYIPSTAKKEHRIVEEFGFAFRALDTRHQVLILVDHFDGFEIVEQLMIFSGDGERRRFFGEICGGGGKDKDGLEGGEDGGGNGGRKESEDVGGGSRSPSSSGIQARLDLAWTALNVEWRKREREMKALKREEIKDREG